LAQVQAATASRVSLVRRDHSMLAVARAPTRNSPSQKLTWTGSTLRWNCARSRFPNCEKRPLCLYR
jgi:hypothetical protein